MISLTTSSTTDPLWFVVELVGSVVELVVKLGSVVELVAKLII